MIGHRHNIPAAVPAVRVLCLRDPTLWVGGDRGRFADLGGKGFDFVAEAVETDLRNATLLLPLVKRLAPGLDAKSLAAELRERISEELDYNLEATSQQAFADAYAGDPDIYVPPVVEASGHVLVTEWMNGTPLSKIISDGSQEERNRAGILLVRFLFSGPERAGLLHADPHPGNFRLLDDGRLGVLDFGAVDRLPDGFPRSIGRLLRIMHDDGDIRAAEQVLRDEGFLREGVDVDTGALRAFLAPLADPSRGETFKFSREWLRGEAARVTDPRSSNLGRQLNLPPSYVLIHRVSTAGIGVLCQLECEGRFRAEVIGRMPGYSGDADEADEEGAQPTGRRESRSSPKAVKPARRNIGAEVSTRPLTSASVAPRSAARRSLAASRPR